MTDASLPPATVEGTLEKTCLAQVVAHALERKLTGTLQLEAPGGNISTVVLSEGWPCKARTTEPHYLGMLLHTLGLIDDTQHNASLARLAKERRPHGQILLEMGVITEEGLLRGLRTQLAGKVEPLFGLGPSTMYRYYEGFDALVSWGGPEVALADPLPMLWAAIQRWPPTPHVDAVLARIDKNVAMRIVPRMDLERFRFAPRTRDLVEALRHKPLALDGMIATELADPRGAGLLVFCMALTKQLAFSIIEQPSKPVSSPPRTPTSPSSAPPLPADSSPPGSKSTPPKLRSEPPQGVLLTPELSALRQGIIDRVATIMDEDYFRVLGIPREAPVAIAQQAYIALAKSWHPDRLAPQLFDVRDLAQKCFIRMTEARGILTDPEKRAAYVVSLKQGTHPVRVAGPAPGMTGAAFEFQKAELFLKKRDLVLADEHCRRAHEADPANADYVALLTWIEVEREGASTDNLPKHMDALDRALKMNERCERAYFYRGMLYKRLNKPEKAFADFQAAAAINPKNIDAAREVYLFRKRST